MKSKPCKQCGSDRHTAFSCPRKARSSMSRRSGYLKPGKQAARWSETRLEWIKQHPLSKHGKNAYYQCYICKIVNPEHCAVFTAVNVMLDHVKSRARHPELRNDLSNLRPICATHNREKGSLDLEQYVRKAIEENKKGKTVVLTIPTQSYVNLLIEAGAELRSLGRVRWLEKDSGEPWKSPSPITCFILRGKP